MSTADTYLVFFAAVSVADTLFVIWLSGSVLLNAVVYITGEKLSARINTWLLVLYSLFALTLFGRWVVTLTKVVELTELLREQGEALPAVEVSMLFGVSMVSLFVLFSLFTGGHILSRRTKIRVI